MWTAEITKIAKNPDELTLTVTYRVTDGVSEEIKTEPLVSRADKISIWRLAQDRADFLNRVDAQKQAIADLDPDTVLGPVDLSPPPPIPPDPELISFLGHLKIYKEVLGLVAIKKITEADQVFVDAVTTIKNDLGTHPEYQVYLAGL